MRRALLRGNALTRNQIFDRSSFRNRDNCFDPYACLREEFFKQGVQLDTADFSNGIPVDFEIHQDFQKISQANLNYLLMFETAYIKPENSKLERFDKYRKIFTWNDDLVDGERFIKINFPNPISLFIPNGFKGREQFSCLISSNVTASLDDEKILYKERVKVIRWFERNAPQDFNLYGVGWNLPEAKNGYWGKFERRLWKILSTIVTIKHFPSYRGLVAHKKDVLQTTRFAFCYENVRNLNGYITEKIFDCFFSGCVPVYWGAKNISRYIPQDCYIDRAKFSGIEEIYKFLKSMNESEFLGYQERIDSFLRSEAVYPFSSDYFAKTVVKNIVRDLDVKS